MFTLVHLIFYYCEQKKLRLYKGSKYFVHMFTMFTRFFAPTRIRFRIHKMCV